ncbi:type 2 isopentenyl-diphosphate Delta-isomerase [Methermicoccus shengliensis]|uniref:Isopentenyl-diphosphate delta-isomerase n=1 Tax=Methermicoccus shengliensis TaxID=660064 RepID=A0A832RX78_9EURY|nr:MAG: Isopentenyl-diphosphate delta-isomerase [Euryarchaeota archaeon 55_53]KUK30726.1 MAG: Isopentenyl-diphosphate delta-isomerase [Methanosarcinales archeaon 56_1174]MDI3487320.1 isopentenyl-diphosphate Delta-isomerase [Methanosarcinales archaeon]MDN5294606.1 isopentenyl-diphosphate Delta-isomerase [Methanosarcinales archaeon]HIH69314.1 type 2 isopentenyl-diphosphate Delta-isomerase [Methermicoccus shengliensis]
MLNYDEQKANEREVELATSRRKIEHIDICTQRQVEARPRADGTRASGLDDLMLVHRALPELNMSEIDLRCTFLGKRLDAPLLISSMTGGHPETLDINRNLAIAAQRLGIGIGVGSQRAALEDASQQESYTVVREVAPDAFIYGNIGAAQLARYGVDGVMRSIEMLDADAMAIHLNFLQEAIQPEGDTDAAGVLHSIEEVCASGIPVIVKETGAGIRREDALRLKEVGVSAIDVAGCGGTSWAGVEYYRNRREGMHTEEVFWNWGIPTAVSVVECGVGMPLIASGGIRSGLDCAKCIALGADVCAIALPLVKRAIEGSNAVEAYLTQVIQQLKIAMFLSASHDVDALKRAQIVICGLTREILTQRGHDTRRFAMR